MPVGNEPFVWPQPPDGEIEIAIGMGSDDVALLKVSRTGWVVFHDVELNISDRLLFVSQAMREGWPLGLML